MREKQECFPNFGLVDDADTNNAGQIPSKPGGQECTIHPEEDQLFSSSIYGGSEQSTEVMPHTVNTIAVTAGMSTMGELGQSSTPQKSPKRKKNPQYLVRKKARNSGHEYYTREGKRVAEKSFIYYECSCKNKCKDVTQSKRKKIFEAFWSMNSWQSQSTFMLSSVQTYATKRPSVRNSRRSKSRIFTLDGKKVCKAVFLKTLAISNNRLNYCLNKKGAAGMISPDKRGKITPNKTSPIVVSRIREFLDSIPRYKSHYTSSNKTYFSSELTKEKLYSLYKDKQQELGKPFCSKTVFSKHLTLYDVGIYVPKADTCYFCDETSLKLKSSLTEDERVELENKVKEHHTRAEKARMCLQETTCEAKGNRSLLAFTFDMQATKPLPKLNTSIVFYKRQLWIYNLGIHSLHDSQGHMFMWCENEGKRGSREVCSSILAYLKSTDLSCIKTIRTFSDCCGGQNRNKTILSFFMWVCDHYSINEWEHIYMESGHSYLPNDRDFGFIEKNSRKHHQVYCKEEWYKIVKDSQKKRPFIITDMSRKFINTELITRNRKFVNNKTNCPEKFNFLKLKSFKVKKGSSVVHYTTPSSPECHFEWHCPLIKEDFFYSMQEYGNINPISLQKYNDLKSMLPLIPPVHHHFYSTLPYVGEEDQQEDDQYSTP